MEGERGVIRSIIDELYSSDMVSTKVKMVLLEVSLMNFILQISKESKWKLKVVLLEVAFMNFVLGISNWIKWKVKVVLLEVSLMNLILGISK